MVAPAGPDRALERRLLDDVAGHVYLADWNTPEP